MTTIDSHDAYIAAASEELRPLLRSLHETLARALPDAEEVIAYKMPGFRIGQTVIAGYAAFTRQCGLYVSPAAISTLAEDIAEAGFKTSKTGITFTPDKPLPNSLVVKLARASRKNHGY